MFFYLCIIAVPYQGTLNLRSFPFSHEFPLRFSVCLSMSKIVQAEYRAKLCLSYVEAPPIFEAKPHTMAAISA